MEHTLASRLTTRSQTPGKTTRLYHARGLYENLVQVVKALVPGGSLERWCERASGARADEHVTHGNRM